MNNDLEPPKKEIFFKKLYKKYHSFTQKLFPNPRINSIVHAGLFSIFIAIVLYCIFLFLNDLQNNGVWTFITLVMSAPVAFTVWRFRDENTLHQIENQRKDVNLKEFQKIAEWVSGLHFQEGKTITKTINKSNPEDIAESTETSTETFYLPEYQALPSHSRHDGAVGLQIAAIYSLLPFYRGDHGESFEKPALNLLKSAWLALHQQNLQKLRQASFYEDEDQYHEAIDQIQKYAKSPLGIAITQVLLSIHPVSEKILLRKHPEVFPNLCLCGMNFHLAGVDSSISKRLFVANEIDGIQPDCSGIQLQGANLQSAYLQSAYLQGANLQSAYLQSANLQSASLQEAGLQKAKLWKTNLQEASLWDANLKEADLQNANLQGAALQEADLQGAALQGADLQKADLWSANLQEADLWSANLQEAGLQGVNLQSANLEDANLKEAGLQNANLQNANLWSANLQEANLRSVNLLGTTSLEMCNAKDFTGSIVSYSDKHADKEKWHQFKEKGGIILYTESGEDTNQDHVDLDNKRVVITGKNGQGIFYYLNLPITINLPETQQENPDWEISIEDI